MTDATTARTARDARKEVGVSDDISKYIGYFTSHNEQEPTYDPAHDSPCLLCDEPLREDDVRTISLMWQDNAQRSYFYRVHRTCHEKLTTEEAGALDGRVLDAMMLRS